MSEFGQSHELSKFIGNPPGYLGSKDGGLLTNALKKHPNSIVLLDEIEKAHVDVLSLLLPALDEGILTDGKGMTVRFPNAIFIMTSNLAAFEIEEAAPRLRSITDYHSLVDEMDKVIEHDLRPEMIRRIGRPEFLARVQKFLLFLPLTKDFLVRMTEKELREKSQLLHQKYNVKLTWSPNVIEKLQAYYSTHSGSRKIQNIIDTILVPQIAKALAAGKLHQGDHFQLVLTRSGDIEGVVRRDESDNGQKITVNDNTNALKAHLESKIIGQPLVIKTVTEALQAKNLGLIRQDRPMVMLFLGTTGTGKTEMVSIHSNFSVLTRGKNNVGQSVRRIHWTQGCKN